MPLQQIAANIQPAVPPPGSPLIIVAATPFIAVHAEVVLQINPTSLLPQMTTAPISILDGANTIPMVDENGYMVRADRLVRRVANMPPSLATGTLAIKVRVKTDPARIVCCTPLPRSAYQGGATNADTAVV